MKTNMLYVLALFCMMTPWLLAQTQTVTVEASSEDISNNLDLKAVASTFGESKNLEDFEKRLNDYDNQLSNLDLNGDGEVDYLRVIETTKNKVHLIVIQAVLGQDIFQDVASILVEKDETTKKATVQVVGDSYIYGPNYVVEPVYIYVPVIFDYFWGPMYARWYSPYYWGYYPTYYRPRPFVHVDVYISHIHHYHAHHHGSYRYPSRPHHHHHDMYNEVSRRDYASRHPQGSYDQRNGSRTGTYGNARDLNTNRPARQGSISQPVTREASLDGGRVPSTSTRIDGRTEGRTGTTVTRPADKDSKTSGSRTLSTGTKTTVRITPDDTRTSRETNSNVESSGRTTTTRVERDNGTTNNREVRTSSSSSSSRSGSETRTSSSSSSSRSGRESSTSTSSSSSTRNSGSSSSSVRQGGSAPKETGTRSTGTSNGGSRGGGQERTGRR